MTLRGTMPAMENRAASCAVTPIYTPISPSVPLTIVFSWTGPEAGKDSLTALSGQPFLFQRPTAAGTYVIRAAVRDADFNFNCSDTTITASYRGAPDKVRTLTP